IELVPDEIAKKPETPTCFSLIMKIIFAKPINSKAVTEKTTSDIAGRVLSQSTPGTPSVTIKIAESGVIASTFNFTMQICICANCYNNLVHENERQKAIKACLDNNTDF
uniref:Uncharacterized protein n=1 Tax=Marmota marmota marmota TaxID=9994 RepID=A0A8C6A937_MARMA